jgi:CspA family cold shock protein
MNEERRRSGRIKHIKPGFYGFIMPDDGGRDSTGRDWFFHLSDFQDKVAPCEGEAVTYLVGSDRKSGREKAIDVRRAK